MTSSFTLLAGIICLYVFGGFMMARISHQSAEIMGGVGSFELTEKNVYMLVLKLFFLIVVVLAPLIVTIVATSITSQVVQDGGRLDFRWERLTFDFSKLNPLNGFGRIFNKTALVEILKSFLKTVGHRLDRIPGSCRRSPEHNSVGGSGYGHNR